MRIVQLLYIFGSIQQFFFIERATFFLDLFVIVWCTGIIGWKYHVIYVYSFIDVRCTIYYASQEYKKKKISYRWLIFCLQRNK